MVQVIIQNMSLFFHMYAGRGSRIGVVVFFLALGLGLWQAKRQGGSLRQGKRALIRSVAAAFLAMYAYIVIGITMLSRSEGYSPVINLRLFSTFGDSFFLRMYVYENILLFVPLSMLLFLLAEPFQKIWVSLMTGFCASLAIETAQLLTCRGRFEADDLLTNTFGMLVGYCMCKLPALLFARLEIRHDE